MSKQPLVQCWWLPVSPYQLLILSQASPEHLTYQMREEKWFLATISGHHHMRYGWQRQLVTYSLGEAHTGTWVHLASPLFLWEAEVHLSVFWVLLSLNLQTWAYIKISLMSLKLQEFLRPLRMAVQSCICPSHLTKLPIRGLHWRFCF